MTTTIRWPGPSDADINTDYRIESDEGTPGTFVALATQDATTPYASVGSTLVAAIAAGDTSFTLAAGTNFSDADYAVVDREMFLLGGKATDDFTDVAGGQGGTTKQAHAAGASIFKAHESYVDTPSWTGRHCITYRVIRIQGAVESIAAESVAVNPTAPTTNNLTTLWGVLEWFGERQVGKTVTLTITDGDNYLAGTGEQLYKQVKSTTTSAEGYWEITGVPRDIDRIGGDLFTLVIDSGGVGSQTHNLAQIPDRNAVNIWECV